MRQHILSIVGGLVVGMIANMVIVVASVFVYPLPEGFKHDDPEALAKHVATLPAGAMLFALAAHGAGSFVGGGVCSLISRRRAYDRGLVIGTIMLAAGIWNMFQIPHPAWFAVADIVLYIPLALAGSYVGGSLVAKRPAAPAP